MLLIKSDYEDDIVSQEKENNGKKQSLNPDSYNRVLDRVDKNLSHAEAKTWDAMQGLIHEAVELEQDISELSKEEMGLLKAYTVRDIKSLYQFMKETGQGVKEWLKLDLTLLEDITLNRLLSIADKTWVEQEVLEQKLENHPGDYIAGEIAAAGMLECVNCGHMMCLVDTSFIEPCHQCESLYFHRVTSRWPADQPEKEE